MQSRKYWTKFRFIGTLITGYYSCSVVLSNFGQHCILPDIPVLSGSYKLLDERYLRLNNNTWFSTVRSILGKYIHYNKAVFSSGRSCMHSKSIIKGRVDHQRTSRSVRLIAQT